MRILPLYTAILILTLIFVLLHCEMFTPISVFLHFFCLRVQSSYRTDRWTDGRTSRACGLLGRSRENFCVCMLATSSFAVTVGVVCLEIDRHSCRVLGLKLVSYLRRASAKYV